MIKKIMGFLIAASLLSGMFTAVSSEETTPESFRYLQMLDMGFLSDEEEAEYIVTRGEFAQILCKVCRIDETDTASIYNDVKYGDEYYTSIQGASKSGIMVGYEDGSFRAEEPIKVNEVVKSFVDALGYQELARAYGGFPGGYIKVADRIDLFKYTAVAASNAAIKRRELGIMLYNLMTAHVNEISGIKNGTAGYSEGEETFSEKYHGLVNICDVVYANGYTNFSKTIGSVGEDEIVVGDKSLKVKDFKERFLIGRYVSVFYDEEEERIVSITERVEDEEILEISSRDVASLFENGISYKNGSQKKTLRFNDTTTYVYNDKTVLSYDFTTLSGEKDYLIRVIDRDGKGEYDIVFIENYYTVVAGDISSDMTVKNKLVVINESTGVYEEGKTVNIDDERDDYTLLVCDSDYKRLESKDIKVLDVLSVIENESYTRIAVSRGNISGQIDGVSTLENGATVLIMGDNEVNTVSELLGYLSENSVIGKKAVIYTDVYGDAAYIAIETEEGEMCGLLVKSRFVTDVEEQGVIFKIFTDKGEEMNIYAADKIRINNESYKVELFSALPPVIDSVTDVPVLYELNSEGKVKKLTLPEKHLDGNNDGLFLGGSVSNVTFSYAQKTFGGKIEAGADTVAFVLGGGIYDEKTSMVLNGNSGYDTTRQYTVDAYYKSRNNDTADILVVKTNLQTANYNTPVAVVTKVGTVMPYQDEFYPTIEYLSGGNVIKAYIDNNKYPAVSIAALGKGDTIRISVDPDGFAADIDHIYDYDSESYKLSSNPTNSNFNDSIVMGWGYVARNSNGRIRNAPTKAPINDTSVFDLQMHVLSGYDLMLVESDTDIRKCSADDIKVGDKFVYVVRGGAGKAIVAYRE